MSYELDYTRGEWILSKTGNSNNANYLIYTKEKCSCCNTIKEKTILRHECHNSVEQDKNFKLIAAAPKMFELLKKVIEVNNTHNFNGHLINEQIHNLLTEITKS